MAPVEVNQELRVSNGKKNAHVLMVASSLRSNLDFFLQILQRLSQKYPGMTATFLSSREQVECLEIARSKGNFRNLDLRVRGDFDSSPNTTFKGTVQTKFDRNYTQCESFRKELLAHKDAPGAPTCIISSKFFYWCQDLATELGIPWYPSYPSPMFAASVIESPKFLEAGVHSDTSSTLITAVPGLIPAPFMSFLRVEDWALFDSREFFTKLSDRLKRASAVLLNVSEGMDLHGGTISGLRTLVKSSRVLPIGPFLQYPGFGFSFTDSTDAACLHWLDSQSEKSVLFIAFGSAAWLSEEKISEIAAGVEASGVPFLWALQLGFRKLSEVLPPGFAERTKGRGLIETSFAPQSKILCHRSIGGFLNHCGWNSLLESIYMGVPVIGWPLGSGDLHINLRYLVDVEKAGYSLCDFKDENKHTFEGVGRQEVEKAVRHVLKGNGNLTVRKNMDTLRNIMQADVAEGGSSYQNLHAFLDEIANP